MSVIRYQDDKVAVIESPPSCRTIHINKYVKPPNDDAYMSDHAYYFAFPWMVFVIPFCKRDDKPHIAPCVYVGFRNSPMTDDDQTLCSPHLYNIYPDLRVCMARSVRPRNTDIKALYGDAIQNFWGGHFMLNMSLHSRYLRLNAYSTDIRVRTHDEWERNTRENP